LSEQIFNRTRACQGAGFLLIRSAGILPAQMRFALLLARAECPRYVLCAPPRVYCHDCIYAAKIILASRADVSEGDPL
jgi:hypothetical protein